MKFKIVRLKSEFDWCRKSNAVYTIRFHEHCVVSSGLFLVFIRRKLNFWFVGPVCILLYDFQLALNSQ